MLKILTVIFYSLELKNKNEKAINYQLSIIFKISF